LKISRLIGGPSRGEIGKKTLMLKHKTRSPTTTPSGLSMIEVLIVVAILALLIVIFLNYFNPLKKRDRAIDARRKADDLKPYLGTIPCDPATHQSYDYQPEDSDCPQYYRIYTHLYWQEDPDIARVGCELGCGRPHYDYEYGVSSPNVGLEKREECDGQWYVLVKEEGTERYHCNYAGEDVCPYRGDGSFNTDCYCDDTTCGGNVEVD